jgi:hypothetical protein
VRGRNYGPSRRSFGEDADALVEEGFVLVRAVIPESDASAAAQEANSLLTRPAGRGHDPFSGMLDFPFPQAAPLLNRLVMGSFFRDFYEAVAGRAGEVYRAHIWSKFGGAASYAQELHVDGNDHSLLAPADAGSPDQLVFFLYLSRVDGSSGPTAVVPLGAFDEARNPTPNEAAALRSREVDVVAERGDCLVFTTGVAHRATELRGSGSRRTTVVVAVGPRRAPWLGRKVWVTSENISRWTRLGSAPLAGTSPDAGADGCAVVEPVGLVATVGHREAVGPTAGLTASAVLALDEDVLNLVERAVAEEVLLCDCAVFGSAGGSAAGFGALRLRLDRTHPDLSRTSRGGVAAWMAVCLRQGLAPSGSGSGAPPGSGIVAGAAPPGVAGVTLELGVAAVWEPTDEVLLTAPAEARTLVVAAYLPRSRRGAWGLGWFSSIDGGDWNEFVSSLPIRAVCALGVPEPENPVWSPAVVAGTARRYRRTDLPGAGCGR